MTVLRTLPLRLPIADGESVDSWIEALGRRYRLAPRAMLSLLGITTHTYNVSALMARTSPLTWRAAEHAAGLAPGQLQEAARVPHAAVMRLRSGGSRFCPRCLAAGNGHWQRSWRWNWAVACLSHQLLLLDACPQCLTAPRIHIPGGRLPIPPSTCTNLTDPDPRHDGGQRCGADLSVAVTRPASECELDVQHWIDELTCAPAGSHAHIATPTLADLPTLTRWLLRHAFDRTTLPLPANGTLPSIDAALTATILAKAKVILAGDDQTAILAFTKIIPVLPSSGRIPPWGLSRREWTSLNPVFSNRFLRASDSGLKPTDRLRYQSVTANASIPPKAPPERIRSLPQLLWPEQTAQLLPISGFEPERFRAVMSACVLIPGTARDHTLTALAGALNPRLNGVHISATFQALQHTTGTSALEAVLTLLCRLATYLDTSAAPIDYQRRRQRIPAETISWPQWRDLAYAASEHPGDQPDTGRHLHIQRHLHQLLSGSDLADPRHPLAFHSAQDRSRCITYLTTMTPKLRQALHEHAAALLDRLGIHEPVSWSPPADLAKGLTLPGVDLNGLDHTQLRRIIIDQHKTPADAATALGVNIEHIRLAIEHLDRPERRWGPRAKPSLWLRDQQAAEILTRDFFEREYLLAGKTLAQLGQATGFSKETVARHARRVGISPSQTLSRTTRIHPSWLREQYQQRRRSTADIAAEIGTTQMTVNRALQRFGIPPRPSGVQSHPHLLTVLDQRLPTDIKKAIEGSLHGWHRLNRFQIAMAFPSIETAAYHLGAHQSALVTQFRRLEADIGAPLFERSTPATPHRPTKQGKHLLKALDRPHIQALMDQALGDTRRHLPDQAILDQALAHHQQRTNPGPLTPFTSITVERLRLTTPLITVLRHILDQPGEFYGHAVAADTGIALGTLYPMLKRLQQAGWLTSRQEDEQTWLATAPPGRGPRRRRTYYTLTPQGRRAATHETQRHTTSRRKRKNTDTHQTKTR